MNTLGIVTIGQAPRDDIVALFAAQAPPGTKVVLRGALDGLSDEEVDALPPLNGADTLYTRLRGGRDVKISKQAVIARSPAALAKLRADGCDAIVYACTGEFPPMEGDAGVLFPSRVLSGIAEGLLPRGRLGLLVPFAEQARSLPRNGHATASTSLLKRWCRVRHRKRRLRWRDASRQRDPTWWPRLHELCAAHKGRSEGRGEGADPARDHGHRPRPARAARRRLGAAADRERDLAIGLRRPADEPVKTVAAWCQRRGAGEQDFGADSSRGCRTSMIRPSRLIASRESWWSTGRLNRT